MRVHIRQRRVALGQRKQKSFEVLQRLIEIPDLDPLDTWLVYVSHASEVVTESLIEQRLTNGYRTAVPWCESDRLKLFLLESMSELSPGTHGIREPLPSLRSDSRKQVSIEDVQTVLLPGIAFDERGGRLGQGRGYYDKLLSTSDSRIRLIGLAFDCQIVEAVPCDQHDIRLNYVVTETQTYRCP